MYDVCKHPTTLADATRSYVKATSSSVHFLIAEKEWMAKELHMAKQGGELITTSTRAELKKSILDEVLSLETIMRALYSKFGTVHKVVAHLNRWKQWCAKRERILSNMHASIDYMQMWAIRYKGAPLHLSKMMKPRAVELKARIQS